MTVISASTSASSPLKRRDDGAFETESLDDNMRLLSFVQQQLRSDVVDPEADVVGNRLVMTNLKLFNSHSSSYYRGAIVAPTLDKYSRLKVLLSEEDETLFQHDLVGLLQLLHQLERVKQTKRFVAKSTPSTGNIDDDDNISEELSEILNERSMHCVLDGGRKTRNFLLTLYCGYQGAFPMLQSVAWQNCIEQSIAMSLQFPSNGKDWFFLSSSDYDIIPSRLSIGGQPIARHLDDMKSHHGIDVDMIFFASKVDPCFSQIIIANKSLIDEIVSAHRSHHSDPTIPLEDFVLSTLEQRAAAATATTTTTTTSDNNKHGDLKLLVKAISFLTSKGILLADKDGNLLDFVEKPTVPRLIQLCEVARDRENSVLMENVMYSAMKKHLLPGLLDAFSSLSLSSIRESGYSNIAHPWYTLRHCVPFGFYNTLAASPFATEQEWLKDWDSKCPKNTFETAWHQNGVLIYRTAVRFMKDRKVFVADFGSNAIINDLGEPHSYLKAVVDQAFTDSGRTRASFAQHTPASLIKERGFYAHQSYFDNPSRVEVAVKETALFVNTVVLTNGSNARLVVQNNNNSRVVFRDTIIDLRNATEDLVVTFNNSYNNNNNNNFAGNSSSSSSVFVYGSRIVGGGRIEGRRSIVMAFDNSNNSSEALVIPSGEGHVVTTLSLHSSEGNTELVTTTFPIDSVATRTDPVTKLRPLDARIIGSKYNFAEAVKKMNLNQHISRINLLRKEIASYLGKESTLPPTTTTSSGSPVVCNSWFGTNMEDTGLVCLESSRHLQPAPRKHDDTHHHHHLHHAMRAGSANKNKDNEYLRRLVADTFRKEYDGEDPQVIVSCPGRLNLGAAHTDWAFMDVAAFCIDHRIFMALGSKKKHHQSDEIHIYSLDAPHGHQKRVLKVPHKASAIDNEDGDGMTNKFELERLEPGNHKFWSNYVVGIIEAVINSKNNDSAAIEAIKGMQIVIASNLPQGCGLSSSAALELCVAYGVSKLIQFHQQGPSAALVEEDQDYKISLAQLSNRVENEFIGVKSGILDQLTCGVGRQDEIVVIRCHKQKPYVIKSVHSSINSSNSSSHQDGEDGNSNNNNNNNRGRFATVVIDTGTSRKLASVTSTSTASKAHNLAPITVDDEHTPWYEKGMSDFNIRVLRYWCGVCLLTSLPVASPPQDCNDNSNNNNNNNTATCGPMLRLESAENPTLLATPEECAKACQMMPEHFVMYEDKSKLGRSLEEKKAQVRALFGIVPKEEPTSLSTPILPVILKDDYDELTHHTRASDRQYHYIGCISEEQFEQLVAKGVLSRSHRTPTKPLLRLVEYMVREDMRVKILADILDDRLQQAGNDIEMLNKRKRLAQMLKEHAAYKEKRGLAKRAAFEYELAEKIVSSSSTNTNTDHDDNNNNNARSSSPLKLTPLERAVIQGALGDLSWEDKRVLFEGDSRFATLDRAYKYAETYLESSHDEDDPDAQFTFLGKIGAGAGFAGMAPVYINRGANDANINKLRCMITGRVEQQQQQHAENTSSTLVALTPQDFIHMGLPLDFVPYSQLKDLEVNANMRADDTSVWMTGPSKGLCMEQI